MNSHCTEEGSDKPLLYFYQENTWIEDKTIEDTVLDDRPLRLDGTQRATEEELRIFSSTNDVYDMTKLSFQDVKLLLLLLHRKTKSEAQRQNYNRNME